MNEKKLRDHLADFYGDQSLSPQKVKRLITMAEQEGPREESNMQSRRWTVLVGLVAAAIIVLALVGLQNFRLVRTTDTEPGSPPTMAEKETRSSEVSSYALPNLIAVKIHADWCARSPIVEPIFADLTEKYGNQPILFVTIDITDDVLRKQSQLLASNLGIKEEVFDAPFESGMVKLIDRSKGEVLAILTEEAQTAEMESLMAEALTGDER